MASSGHRSAQVAQFEGHDVRVIESARRKKTVSARLVDDTIEIRMPTGLSRSERERHIRNLGAKVLSKASPIDLASRARTLAKRYDLPEPSTITWSTRQNSRWGSCTPSTGAVRLSHRLRTYPSWVLDYVIIHELAHLVEPNHSAAFHDLVARFPRAERAEGFLIAVGLGHAGSPIGLTGQPLGDDAWDATND